MRWLKRLSQMMEERTGLALESRQDPLVRLVTRQAREQALEPEDYMAQLLEADSEHPEFVRLVTAVTNGYTYFFRNRSRGSCLSREKRGGRFG